MLVPSMGEAKPHAEAQSSGLAGGRSIWSATTQQRRFRRR